MINYKIITQLYPPCPLMNTALYRANPAIAAYAILASIASRKENT